jgi:hypothetical protein
VYDGVTGKYMLIYQPKGMSCLKMLYCHWWDELSKDVIFNQPRCFKGVHMHELLHNFLIIYLVLLQCNSYERSFQLCGQCQFCDWYADKISAEYITILHVLKKYLLDNSQKRFFHDASFEYAVQINISCLTRNHFSQALRHKHIQVSNMTQLFADSHCIKVPPPLPHFPQRTDLLHALYILW